MQKYLVCNGPKGGTFLMAPETEAWAIIDSASGMWKNKKEKKVLTIAK
jgi:hypothetical protein